MYDGHHSWAMCATQACCIHGLLAFHGLLDANRDSWAELQNNITT